MRIAILDDRAALSDYTAEVLRTWGLCFCETLSSAAVAQLEPTETPVAIAPAAQLAPGVAEALNDYARRGGSVVCFAPRGSLAAAAGLEERGDKPVPLRLRVTGLRAGGLAGEQLPIVGEAREYAAAEGVRVLAYLARPEVFASESPGITHRRVGAGAIVAFAFDLPRCVMLLRQGDPAKAEWVPPESFGGRPGWPSAHTLACDIGPLDCGWAPYADLLARALVDLVRQCWPGPAPMLWHLPGDAPSVLLYSGDEDGADVAWNDQEFDEVAAAGGRMNLYIIPGETQSTAADAPRYLAHHDLGPHPNLRPLDGRPREERVAAYERQVRDFEQAFGVRARSVRNHCLAWVGYTDLPEAQERLGVRMDANYLAGAGLLRHRVFSPYADFGAAMPMRFGRPDGRLIDVFQQHFHIEDDSWFSDHIDYSAKLAPEQFEPIIERCLDDAAGRFHMPFGANYHPSNWVKFSREPGLATLRQAAQRGITTWSFDQWCAFWEARDACRIERLAWDGTELSFTLRGPRRDDLRVLLPRRYAGAELRGVEPAGTSAAMTEAVRYREAVALIASGEGAEAVEVVARYG